MKIQVALAMIALPCAMRAQLTVESGGGAAHLDQMQPGAVTSLGAALRATSGQWNIALGGYANDHVGLGSIGRFEGGVQFAFGDSAWRVLAGPVAEVGRDIARPMATAFGSNVLLRHNAGAFSWSAAFEVGRSQQYSAGTVYFQPVASASYRLGAFSLRARWQLTATRDTATQSFAFDTVNTGTGSHFQNDTNFHAGFNVLHDASFGLSWARGLLELSADAGERVGASVNSQFWWNGVAAVQVSPGVTLTLRSGRSPVDPILGLRGATSTQLGLRLGFLQRSNHGDAPDARAMVSTRVVRESPAQIRILFTLPATTLDASVESDLTEWKARTLTHAHGNTWELLTDAVRGVYRINISTDGGPWTVPPGLSAANDEFGGRAGLLVVEQ